MIDGKGNPNHPQFADSIKVLYALSYGVKMSAKKNRIFQNTVDYTVYTLESVWDISETAKKKFKGIIDKNKLVFTLMIRQPDWISRSFAEQTTGQTKKKKPHALLDKVKFVEHNEGLCVQILHTGRYDSEPESFSIMEAFCENEGFQRLGKCHREIYLSDARKTPPEKMKTVLRFQVKKDGSVITERRYQRNYGLIRNKRK